jgi:bifunctional UDP-N-acetylglucosamine pyrophosphorylase / glucosamine-1-phosphate N-acetyltransferase
VGPFAHIRQGTAIGSYSQVGNFSEIVRSRLGKNVRMKHFSYLGDAEIGASVNIGAGAVIANYDGKYKHKTQVADKAFIGSGSILVAPVRVGKGAITGAGSVVIKPVKDNSLVVGVPAREIKKKRLGDKKEHGK